MPFGQFHIFRTENIFVNEYMDFMKVLLHSLMLRPFLVLSEWILSSSRIFKLCSSSVTMESANLLSYFSEKLEKKKRTKQMRKGVLFQKCCSDQNDQLQRTEAHKSNQIHAKTEISNAMLIKMESLIFQAKISSVLYFSASLSLSSALSAPSLAHLAACSLACAACLIARRNFALNTENMWIICKMECLLKRVHIPWVQISRNFAFEIHIECFAVPKAHHTFYIRGWHFDRDAEGFNCSCVCVCVLLSPLIRANTVVIITKRSRVHRHPQETAHTHTLTAEEQPTKLCSKSG